MGNRRDNLGSRPGNRRGDRGNRRRNRRVAAALATLALVATGCGVSANAASVPAGVRAVRAADGPVEAVAAENQYADVVAQLGGPYVHVTAVITNPNSDPHALEASPRIAAAVSAAALVVSNGAGYDSFMASIEAASPNPTRSTIDVQRLLRRPDDVANPHFWYDPSTMPAVARAVVADLTRLRPQHADYFRAALSRFLDALAPWQAALRALRTDPAAAVATTEPVADYLLGAAGVDNRTPWVFQADLMNGTDPSPQAMTQVRALLADRQVRAFLYNVQVTDTLTTSLRGLAEAQRIPVVAVYETMPRGFHYQSWMLAETRALQRALDSGASTQRL